MYSSTVGCKFPTYNRSLSRVFFFSTGDSSGACSGVTSVDIEGYDRKCVVDVVGVGVGVDAGEDIACKILCSVGEMHYWPDH